MSNLDLSIVVPLFNEDESIPELTQWIDRVLDKLDLSYEILLIDDGSNDNSWNIIKELSEVKSHIKGLSFRCNYGKSAALQCGFQKCRGEVVITMDADLQDSPDEIPELYKLIKEDGYHIISGWKKKRYDPIMKTVPSKLFNKAASAISGIKLHDFNCGLKAYHCDVVKTVEIYGEMHRYIPYIASQAGFKKIGEKVVIHQARKYGVTKFGVSRFLNGFLDLMSIFFITTFGKRPMHLFGAIGTVMLLIGTLSATYLGIDKLIALANREAMPLVTNSPYFYISLATIIIGVQLFLTGFLGELISRNSTTRNSYNIKEEID